ncbi:MAG TPA: T9SS type A sorting domain-containing protein [Saprospiraceae bacterium]|nr:T9SS type A sorting domain-containing protein [Saprospiraceae bacterium]
MKQLLITTILLLAYSTNNICIGQTEFAPIGSKWYYIQKTFERPEIRLHEYISEKDTIIFGAPCKKIIGVTYAAGLYPNPASHHLFVEPIELAGQISIFDAYGRLVKHLLVSNSHVNISDLPTRLYWISIEDKHKNTFYTYKIAKINN